MTRLLLVFSECNRSGVNPINRRTMTPKDPGMVSRLDARHSSHRLADWESLNSWARAKAGCAILSRRRTATRSHLHRYHGADNVPTRRTYVLCLPASPPRYRCRQLTDDSLNSTAKTNGMAWRFQNEICPSKIPIIITINVDAEANILHDKSEVAI